MGDADPHQGKQAIHRTKLFGGQQVEEVFFDSMFKGARCLQCGSPKPCLRIQTFIAIADIVDTRVRDEIRRQVSKGKIKTTPLTHGPGIKSGEAFACKSCRKELEVAAAKGPSYIVVVFDRLPEADKPLVAVV